VNLKFDCEFILFDYFRYYSKQSKFTAVPIGKGIIVIAWSLVFILVVFLSTSLRRIKHGLIRLLYMIIFGTEQLIETDFAAFYWLRVVCFAELIVEVLFDWGGH
jgi:hypothetical protein